VKDLFSLRELSLTAITAIVVSNVVPPLNEAVTDLCVRHFGAQPLMIGPGVKTGMAIEYEDPREVGADRIVNGVAAYELYGGPAVVVDFGTATTVDAVSGTGHYLGGAIAPGIGISVDALFEHAARLPRVDLVKPRRAIGRNTVHSMQAGIFYGYVGLVKELIRRFRDELSGASEGTPPKVIATGGLASVLSEEVPDISVVDPLLTLKGLRIVYGRNRDELRQERVH
jgi:type III pantothenate kinase